MKKIKLFIFFNLCLVIISFPWQFVSAAGENPVWSCCDNPSNPHICEKPAEYCASFGGAPCTFPTVCTGETHCGMYSVPICCCGTGLSNNVYNTEPAKEAPKFTAPDLQVKIPGLNLVAQDVTCAVDNTGGYVCQVPWIGKYIKAIYNYGLGIAGILAALVLMAGGVLWLVSRGDASRITQAKELIIGSVTGLIILTGSYVLLIQINPDLVNFKSITIGQIPEAELIPDGSDSENNLSTTACAGDNNLKSISGIVSLGNVSDPRLAAYAIDSLKAAVAEADKQNVKLKVTSANRTYAKQKELWDAALKANGGNEAETRKLVAPPSQCQGTCYGHCAGVAIDVCISDSVSCSKMGKKSYVNYSDADVIKLQDIMKKAGWKRYCGEWWHFQAPQNPPKQACSP